MLLLCTHSSLLVEHSKQWKKYYVCLCLDKKKILTNEREKNANQRRFFSVEMAVLLLPKGRLCRRNRQWFGVVLYRFLKHTVLCITIFFDCMLYGHGRTLFYIDDTISMSTTTEFVLKCSINVWFFFCCFCCWFRCRSSVFSLILFVIGEVLSQSDNVYFPNVI